MEERLEREKACLMGAFKEVFEHECPDPRAADLISIGMGKVRGELDRNEYDSITNYLEDVLTSCTASIGKANRALGLLAMYTKRAEAHQKT